MVVVLLQTCSEGLLGSRRSEVGCTSEQKSGPAPGLRQGHIRCSMLVRKPESVATRRLAHLRIHASERRLHLPLAMIFDVGIESPQTVAWARRGAELRIAISSVHPNLFWKAGELCSRSHVVAGIHALSGVNSIYVVEEHSRSLSTAKHYVLCILYVIRCHAFDYFISSNRHDVMCV